MCKQDLLKTRPLQRAPPSKGALEDARSSARAASLDLGRADTRLEFRNHTPASMGIQGRGGSSF